MAYDSLFARMFEQHPYLQAMVLVLQRQKLLAPVISSMKDHVSDRYTSASILADDVGNGRLDVEGFLERLAERIGRTLAEDEIKEIREGIAAILQDAVLSAYQEEPSRFAKNIMEKLNHVAIPALFRRDGIGFDYRTHRTLWALGEEFRVWCVTRSHPNYDGCLVYPTAHVELSRDGTRVERITFDSGLAYVRDGFLRRLHDAYQQLQTLRGTTYVPAWELRAVFCVENRCQRSTFDKVFAERYLGDGAYRLHLEIQRNKPQHEEALRAGDRNIGSVRVIKL